MRFRTGAPFTAEMHARVLRDSGYKPWCCHKRNCACGHHGQWWQKVPPAEPGDTWESHWYSKNGNGPSAGYLICCPKCRLIHGWSTANNCSSRRPITVKGTDGKEYPSVTCDHMGKSSCWEWSGDPKANTLTARPSLYATSACGWHGFLTNGVLEGV